MKCGTACQNTCDNPNPTICTLNCLQSGCYCTAKGYARNSDGKCIPLTECPRKSCKLINIS